MTKPPTIAIPLDLPEVTVTSTTVTKDHTLLIAVESTLATTTCRQCGQEIRQFHGYDRPLTLRHLPVLGMPVFIRIRPKRFRCPFCDVNRRPDVGLPQRLWDAVRYATSKRMCKRSSLARPYILLALSPQPLRKTL